MRKRIAIGVVVALFGGAIAAEAQPTSADLAHAHFVLERTLLTTDIYSDPRVQRFCVDQWDIPRELHDHWGR